MILGGPWDIFGLKQNINRIKIHSELYNFSIFHPFVSVVYDSTNCLSFASLFSFSACAVHSSSDDWTLHMEAKLGFISLLVILCNYSGFWMVGWCTVYWPLQPHATSHYLSRFHAHIHTLSPTQEITAMWWVSFLRFHWSQRLETIPHICWHCANHMPTFIWPMVWEMGAKRFSIQKPGNKCFSALEC